jgi:L-ascorbate metabolism protein UlaG (beta-lactamase superfamily)
MKLKWLGHSAFRLEAGNSVILIDPFLKGNPTFTGDFDEAIKGTTHILITHGHDDHVGDAAEIARATGAQVVSNFEICMFLNAQGAQTVNPGNTGGTFSCGEFKVSFTPALHSSSTIVDGKPIYLGNPNGLVIDHPNAPNIFHFGDTDLFSDMALIEELYKPRIGLVPVGDRFTMSGDTAALAVQRFFKFDHIVPMHYGTFPIIDQTPDRFIEAMGEQRTKIVAPKPGQTVGV